jgi:REP element-mobilizing transposase RayT
MARPLRVEYPGAFYHVINRGNAGENIFRIKRDKERFLECLAKAHDRFSLIIHTYCLMPTHYHALIETPEPNLSAAIQWLNVSYAAYYNNKHHRIGHLFHGRFKALLVDADEYLKELSRYIHLNPVRAKLVDQPSGYRWSSYPAFINKFETPSWLETGWLLAIFGEKRNVAAKNYQNFVEETDVDRVENPNKNAVGGFILGDTGFVDWVKEEFLSVREEDKEIPQLRKLQRRIPLEVILKAVSHEFRCAEQPILVRGRKRNTAREVAILLATDLCGLSGSELGAVFGGISGAAITMNNKHVAGEMDRSRELRNSTNRIKRKILNI